MKLIPLRSNLRDVWFDWSHEHGLAVASVLTALAPEYGVGLVASTAPYHSSALRWGSNPITDPLMSSGMMDIRYDRADASRVEKVKHLLNDPLAVSQLRFCWETEPHNENCGVCSKCTYTACAFMANGIRVAECFTRWPDIDEIRSVRIATPVVAEGLSWVVEFATEDGRADEDWGVTLSEAIAGWSG